MRIGKFARCVTVLACIIALSGFFSMTPRWNAAVPSTAPPLYSLGSDSAQRSTSLHTDPTNQVHERIEQGTPLADSGSGGKMSMSSGAPIVASTNDHSPPMSDGPPSILPSPNTTVMDRIWDGGSVLGPSAADVQTFLDSLFAEFFLSSDEADNVCTLMSGSPSTAEQREDALFSKYLMPLTRRLAAQGLERDDCWMHLAPHQRAMCLILSSLDNRRADRVDPRSHQVPLRRRQAYLESYCSTLTPCMLWQRGRFRLELNASYLEEVYHNEVLRLVSEDDNRVALDMFLQNFVHDGDNLQPELDALWKRTEVQEEDLAKHQVLVDDHREKEDAERRGIIFHRSEEQKSKLRWAESLSPGHDRRHVFQQQRLEFDFSHRSAYAYTSDTGEGYRLEHFSPLQTLSVLHHKVYAGYHRRKRYDGQTSNDMADRISDMPTFRPNLNVIVFSGDSMNREFFMRIIHHVRFGMHPPLDNEYLLQTPFHEPSQNHDMIYSVYETHDQFEVFHSPTSNHRSTHTIQQYFQKLKWDIRLWERNQSLPRPPMALLHMLFYWDPQTDYYRRDLFPSQELLSTVVETHNQDILDAAAGSDPMVPRVMQLGRRDASKAMDIRAASLANSPCTVQVKMNNGEVKTFDFSNGRGVSKMTRENGVAPGGRRHAVVASRFVKSAAYGGVCNAQGRAAAQRMTETISRQRMYRQWQKPVIPLRDFGMRIPVHVQGHIFWELKRDVEMMQHLFAMLIATDDDVPNLPQLPRRATPKDQTELYMLTSSFIDNIQPYLRFLSKDFTRVPSLRGPPSGTIDIAVTQSNATQRQHGGVSELGDEDAPLLQDVEYMDVDDIALEQQNSTLLPSSSLSGKTRLDSESLMHKRARVGLPLRNFRMPKESHFNLIKNLDHFAWFETLCRIRKDISDEFARKMNATAFNKHHHRRQRGSLLTPFRYAKSVSLLELGKLQSMRFVQGDDRHFSCRFMQVKDRNRFTATFADATVRFVLNVGIHDANINPVLCKGGWNTNSSTDANGTATALSLEDAVQFYRRMLVPSHRREELWHVGGMEDAFRKHQIMGEAMTNEIIMHFSDYKEYGVVVHDDHARCRDDGNLFLSEMLLGKMIERDIEERKLL